MHDQVSSKVRVYLVEDQALLRESVRTMLELESDIEVAGEAVDAEQALRELETLDVDVVLMDIRLPRMDGIEATRLLSETHSDVRVVMLTSYGDEYLEDAIQAGASGYILKSCTRQQLVQAIRAACQGQMPIDPRVASRLVREVARLRKGLRESALTPRQVQILALVASGSSHKVIAEKMFVSATTVKREMRAIFDYLGVNDRAQAIAEAYNRKLL